MKLQITKNTYKETNASLYISEDYKIIGARSYDWWEFIKKDSVGNVIFLNSSYSHSTSSHQSTARGILRRLGINIHLTLNKTLVPFNSHGDRYSYGHGSIKNTIESEIKCYKNEIKELIKAIKKKGSWKKVNAERKESIKYNLYKIKDLRRFKNEYLDKKLYPIKKKSLKDFYKKNTIVRTGNCHNSTKTYYHVSNRLSYVKQANTYKELYFKKPNGVINKNGLVETLNKILHYGDAPSDLSKIIKLLGLKKNHIETLLVYQFTQDTNNMIPDEDSKEYIQLKTWLTKNDINKNNLTTLNLDKIHEYLTNKLNRKNHSPAMAKPLPVNETLLKIESKIQDENILKVVKTDQDLRREGRQQSHCIGGKGYLNKCFNGYQALRYKSYTFFLSPDLKIVQTNGKRNEYTPEKIKKELNDLIKEVAA